MWIGENVMFVYGKSPWTASPSPFKLEPTGCPETSVTTNQSCVTSQKSETIIYAVTEA